MISTFFSWYCLISVGRLREGDFTVVLLVFTSADWAFITMLNQEVLFLEVFSNMPTWYSRHHLPPHQGLPSCD